MKSQKINPSHFADQAKQWLDLFLTPFQVHHLPEFMEQHQKFGLSAFSCAPVEKKNHDQVSAFFRKTMKDGGKGIERKSAIFEIYITKIDRCILLKRVL
ncbi:unnamed protein product [Rhizophagus irregularis]|nr:unnamed protein product [Rhizophagus irregularis]